MDTNSLQSYRPISNLPYLSKVLERVAFSRLSDHLQEHSLLDSRQSAYRSNHSVETLLTNVIASHYYYSGHKSMHAEKAVQQVTESSRELILGNYWTQFSTMETACHYRELLKNLVLVISVVCITAANTKPEIYPNWPACKKATEYVTVIGKSERVEGLVYYERIKKNNVKTYRCQLCTQCLHGMAVLAPCSARSDTKCSTECEVPGCVLDEFLQFCRLPGDPNSFESISAMMDPCDSARSKVNRETEVADETVVPFPDSENPGGDSSQRLNNKMVERESRPTSNETPFGTIAFAVSLSGIVLMVTCTIYFHCRKDSLCGRNGGVVQDTVNIEMRETQV